MYLKMTSLLTFAVILAVATAEIFVDQDNSHPNWYSRPVIRHRRQTDVFASGSRNVGGGKVFGELGQNPGGLYGKGGYERNIFNDQRGRLDGQVYGTRQIGPYGDSTHMGGALNWKNDHAAANVDLNRQIHGDTRLNAQAGGHWPVGKNGDFSAGGTYSTRFHGKPDYGANVRYQHRF